MADRISGIRICQECKGICHENSLRTRAGQRRRYFCSEHCAKAYEDARLFARFRKMGIPTWSISDPWGELWTEFRDGKYERVEVRTA